MAKTVTPEMRGRMERGGKWLRRQRERAGYGTGTAFAQALGIRQVRLNSYERGMYQVEPEVAREIARALGLSELDTWRGLELPLPRELDPAAMTDEEVVALVERIAPGRIDRIIAEARGDVPEVTRREPDELGRSSERGRTA